ncbi:YhdP family protein [Andreprevotia chitinilytica]|uniref:YhdP family protein n=1 Tax=Andreprevotia chitinilytica TaxID=396808 RepID=UPI000557E3DD|nr:YhdP family protein [Andreprevotia chitinilytica]
MNIAFGPTLRRAGELTLAVLRWHSRLVLRLLLALAALLVSLALVWQFYLLPRLDEFRPAIVNAIAKAAGTKLAVEKLSGSWRGIFPYLRIDGVTVFDPAGKPAIQLASVDAEVSWLSIPTLTPHFHRLALTAPKLSVARDAQGVWHLGGFALREGHSNDNRFVDWLLAQGELSLTGGEVAWDDYLSGAPVVMTGVQVDVQKAFNRHRFTISVTPPNSLASPLQVDGSWYGNQVADWRSWHGEANFRLDQFDLTRIARWLPASLRGPVAWQGQGGGEISFGFADAQLHRVDLTLQGRNWQGTYADHALRLAQFDGKVSWRLTGSGVSASQQLTLKAARIDTDTGALCRDCSLQVVHDKGWQLEAKDWQLAPLVAFKPLLPPEWQDKLNPVSASGYVKLAHATWSDNAKLNDYSGELSLQNASMAGYVGWPALTGVNLDTKFDQSGGKLTLTSDDFHLTDPKRFVEPLRFNQMKLATSWKRDGKVWLTQVDKLQLQNSDISFSAKGTHRYDGTDLGDADIQADIARLRANRAYIYLPRDVGDQTLAWLKLALKQGEGENGKVVLKGPLMKFPFDGDKGGVFQVTANARDVALHYADGWPEIESINGSLDFHGNRMEIHGRSARILGATAQNVAVLVPNLASPDPMLQVDGVARGPTSEFLRFLHQSPLAKRTDSYLDGLKTEGDGELQLKLDLPLYRSDHSKVSAQYRFAGNQLDFGGGVPVLSAAKGVLGFTESQLQIRDAQAQALGGATHLSGGTDASGNLAVQLSGQAQLAELAKRYTLPFAERFKGSVPYQGSLTTVREGYELALQTPLTGAQIDLPAPLGKSAAESRPLRVRIADKGKQTDIEFGYDRQLQGAFVLRDGQPTSGQIGLNRAPGTPTQPGIVVVGGWPEINLDAWRKVASGSTGKSGGDVSVTGVDVTFGRASGWGYTLNDFKLQLRGDGSSWAGDIASREVAGKLNWNGNGRGKLAAQLSKLTLPLPPANGPAGDKAAAATATSAPSPLQTLPAMDLHVEDFRYKDLQLGKLDVDAVQQGEIWRLNDVTIANADGKATMSGLWRQRPGKSRVEAKFNANTESLGKLLTRLGYPETMKRAPAKISGDLAWDGDLFPPDLNTLEGSMRLDVQAGQFSKIDPGAGRFLSILSLQSLTRRVQLDFRDVFSEGFEFDSIKGEATMQHGVARTDNLVIAGPAAQVLFRGDANFVAGTQNLRVRIVPVVGDSVAVAATIVNPIAGVAAFLLQRILKDPLGQLVAYEYDISGTMRDPQITPVKQLGFKSHAEKRS